MNIIDLTSTKMHGLFVMIILAEIQDQTITIAELQKKLKKKGEELGIQVVAQDESARCGRSEWGLHTCELGLWYARCSPSECT